MQRIWLMFFLCSNLLADIPLEERVKNLEGQVDALKKAPSIYSQQLPFTSTEKSTIYVEADYLCWIAQQERLSFAVSPVELQAIEPINTFANGISAEDAELEKVKPHWDSGFRIGAGIPAGRWQISTNWTHYHTSADDTVRASDVPPGLVPLPVWFTPSIPLFDPLFVGSAEWKLKYDTIDLIVAYPWKVSSFLTLQPQFGLKGAWLRQKFFIDYEYFISSPLVFFNVFSHETIHNRASFSGIGPLFGIEADWKIVKNLNLFADLQGALLYGKLKTSFSEKGIPLPNPFVPGPAPPLQHMDIKDLARLLRFTARIAVGVQWNVPLPSYEKSHVTLNVGWEQNMWFGIGKFHRFYDLINEAVLLDEEDDLTLQGLMVRLGVDF